MYRKITEEDYKVLLELDKKVYPTNNPVTPEILNQWFKRNPEFGIVFEEDGKITGMLIIIPLSKKGWDSLISGDMEEADMKGNLIFNSKNENQIGLHGYHIEKFNNEKRFFQKSFKALKEVLDKINPDLKILGFSGYAVTTEGISLAYNKLNMKERTYISDEHMMEKDGKLKIITKLNQNKLNTLLKDDYVYHNRCKQLVIYPNEVSIVWKYLK